MDTDLARIVIHCNELALTQPIEDEHLRSLPQADTPYYAFLYYLAQAMKPLMIVELGVYKGVSLAHLAAGFSGAWGIGVDNHKHDWEQAIGGFENVYVSQADSCEFLRNYGGVPIDILHIDTEHTYRQVKEEFELALPLMAKPGVICLDYSAHSEEMVRFWAEIKLPKISLPNLHVTGYGVCLYT